MCTVVVNSSNGSHYKLNVTNTVIPRLSIFPQKLMSNALCPVWSSHGHVTTLPRAIMGYSRRRNFSGSVL